MKEDRCEVWGRLFVAYINRGLEPSSAASCADLAIKIYDERVANGEFEE